jgi:ribonuclease HII
VVENAAAAAANCSPQGQQYGKTDKKELNLKNRKKLFSLIF